MIRHGVHERHRLATLGDATVQFELAIGELARKERDDLAAGRRGGEHDLARERDARVERRSMHEHELARQRPGRLDQDRRACGGVARIVQRDRVPARIVAERVRAMFATVPNVHRKVHLEVGALVGQYPRAGDGVDQARLAALERADHRDAPALGPQPVFVGQRVESRALRRRDPLAAGLRIERDRRIGEFGALGAALAGERLGARFDARGERAHALDAFARGVRRGEPVRACEMGRERAVERPERFAANARRERGDARAEPLCDRRDARGDRVDVAGELGVEGGVDRAVQIGEQLAFHVRAGRCRREAPRDCVDQADRGTAERAEHDRAPQAGLEIGAPRAARGIRAERACGVLRDREALGCDRVEQRCQDARRGRRREPR